MNVNFRNFAIWLVILFMLMGLFQVFQSSTRSIAGFRQELQPVHDRRERR